MKKMELRARIRELKREVRTLKKGAKTGAGASADFGGAPLDGPGVDLSPDDMRELFALRAGRALEVHEALAVTLATLEKRKADHDEEPEHHTIDDLKGDARKKVGEYIANLGRAVALYLKSPNPARVRNGELVIAVPPLGDARALGAAAPETIGFPSKVVPIDIRRYIEAGSAITAEDAALLVESVSQAMIDAAAPCCEGCADGSGPCLDKQLAGARHRLELTEREAGFWAKAAERLPARRTFLSLSQLGRLMGMPAAMLEGL